MATWKKTVKKSDFSRTIRILAEDFLFSPTKKTTKKPKYIGKRHRIVFTKEKRFVDIKLFFENDYE